MISFKAETLIDVLRRRATEQPGHPSYVFLGDGEVEESRAGFDDLDRRARGIGAALAEAGAAGERVLLLFPPGLEFISGFLGCLYGGALAVPAYPPRSQRGLPRLQAIVDDARPRVVLTTAALLERTRALLGPSPALRGAVWLAADGLEARADEWREPAVDGSTIAFLQYTSGSTSTPKGVMVSHANLLHNEEMIRRAFAQSQESVIVGWLPLYHDMGLIGNVLQPLYLGASCVLMSPMAFLQQPVRWLDAISRYRATTSGGPSFAYELCARKVTAEQKARLDLSSWRLAFNGAEPVRAATLERFAREFAACGFRREAFYPCYGLAEATLFATGGEPGRLPVERVFDASGLEVGGARTAEDGRELVGCGRAWMDQRVEVVDPETAGLCPPGRVGEVWIAGPSVARGYWGNAAATERDFHARLAAEPEAGPFLRTGDLGFFHEGELFVTGRLKDLVILRGRNHYPQDLELTAELAHPALRPGCGAAFSVDLEGEERLVIVQELERRAGDGDASEVADAIREAVAGEHEVQVHEVVLIRAGTIPKTSSGKIQRHACRAAWLTGELNVLTRSALGGEEGVPAGGEADADRGSLLALAAEERATALEPALRAWAARALGVPAARVEPDQRLTALGLDSLAAVELQHAVERRLGVPVSIASLLEGATVRGLALEIADGLDGGPAAVPIETDPAIPATGEVPMSRGQKAIWFLQRLAPESAAYHIAAAVRIDGELDPEAMRRAFQAVVDRHPMLRATLHERGGQPVQRIHERMEVAFSLEEAGAGDLAERLRRAAWSPFDLENGPLLRVLLVRTGAREHAMVLAVHHAVADFASLAVMFGELGRLLAGPDAPLPSLPPLPVSYPDFVRWQEERLSGLDGERLWGWWREALRGPLPDLDLPTDRPRPAVQTDRGASLALELGPELTGALHALSRAADATLFTTLLAGFQAVLHRWSGQEDLAVGCPVAGRSAPELAGLVGYFVNPLVIRADASGEPAFAELLVRVRRFALGALEHQDLPFTTLAERLRPVRDPSRSPLFQAMFILQKAQGREQEALAPFALGEAGARIALGPLALSSIPLAGRPVQMDLTLMMAEGRDGLGASLQFNADLFDAATAERLLGHLRTLLAGAAADPGRALRDLPLMTAEETRQVLVEWNAMEAGYPRERTVHELFEEQAERAPDRVAVVSGGDSLTYRELERRASRLARHLEAMGVGPEVPVGVFAERSPELVVGLLGILKAGGAYVPLDPSYPGDRVAFMLDDSRAPVVLAQDRLRPALGSYPGRLVSLDAEPPNPGADGMAGPARRADPDNLAYLIYTSGSTGVPKGVQVPHRGVVNFLGSMARRPGLAADEVLVSVTTPSFDIFGLELYLPLTVGARVVLADRETASDGAALRRLLAESGATAMQATPATWRLLLAAGWDGRPAVRALCGGEALPRELAESLHARAPSVWNLYGPTETTIWSAVHRVEPAADGASATAPVGRPIANTRIYLADPGLRPVPAGVPGELLIGGDGLARGYRGRPDLTAERFVPDPWSGAPGARLYRTGDLARYRADGTIEFLGRLDHQVKIRGFRVELGEIEAALAKHPAVRQAVVVARAEKGGSHRLVAYAVFGGGEPDVGELRRFLAERLPEPFVPSVFVALDRFPLTPNGKVDRKALPAPGTGAKPAGPADAAPRSELERAIAAAWAEVLQLPSVGLNDNFFDLGGHSLLAAELHARLRDELGAELSMVDLFRHPTVSALARFLSPGNEAILAAPAALPRREAPAGRDVAIVGMAGRFPGAGSVGELWRRLRAGDECLSLLSAEELAAAGVDPGRLADPAYVRAAGVIEGAELFDAAFFGFNPREAELMDPQHRVFLECAWQALEDAGYDSERCGGRVGLYAGVGINTYLHHAGVEQVEALAGRYQAFIANDKDFVPTRVSYKLDLKGPSVNVQTACSTSLVALHLACQALLSGDCDMALAGGVAVRSPQKTGYLYEEGGIASPDGHCRAFDAAARGTVFGNGVGLVVLKPLARALADGDTVRAVIRGTAINNDGAVKVGYTAPSVEGQARVIADALAAARVEPETVTYVEAHGTGTPMGDPIEVAALAEVFGARTERRGFCALGSVKTNLGHLDTAAGVAGLIKTVLALEHRELPPSLHYTAPNPRIDFAGSPFYVNAALAPWESDGPRRAGVSSCGIGGTNAHVVLEEAPPLEPAAPSRPWQLLVLSARMPGALDEATRNLADALRTRPDLDLADAAHTLQAGRRAFQHRRALVCRERDEAVAALAALDPERLLSGAAEPGERPVVFLFPGQGSQHAGMARGLYAGEPAFRRELDACAEGLLPHLGLDLRELLFPEPGGEEEAGRELERTAIAQPALFAVEHALACVWMEWGIQARAMLGHSVGEYVAACLAGVFTLEEGLALIAARGRLMQSLPGGAMLGVQLPETELASLLRSPELASVSIAAVNGPAACVASGDPGAVAALGRRLDARGARHRRLHTSHAFHSAMMDPILDRFAAEVGRVRLQAPRLPYISNLTGTWITAAEATDPSYWVRHLRSAVRFADGVRALLAEPGQALLEVGPGNALSTLARPCLPAGDSRVVAASLPHPREAQPDGAVMLRALGRLWMAGVRVDWQGFAAHERRRRVPLPTYPFQRQRFWLEPKAAAPAKPVDRLERKADLADWFHAPLWRQSIPPPRFPEGEGNEGSWLLLADADGPGARLASLLAERLERLGRRATVARTAPPGRREDYDALVEGRPDRIVHLWNVAELDKGRERAFDSLVFLVQALERADPAASVGLTVVSTGLHRIGGESGDLQPERALLLGPVQVIPQEVPRIACRSLDVELPAPGSPEEEDLVDDLLAEASSPGGPSDAVVAWRGGRRWVRAFGPARLDRDSGPVPRVRDGGVYLVTGGLGGVGLALARELAVLARVKLALLGRSATEPGEEARRAIAELEALGAEVMTVAADVVDEVAVAAALAAVEERFGPVCGVIHAAGVPGGGLLQLKTPEAAEKVLAPKVHGTRVLAASLAGRTLDFFVLCSSINSVIGGFGQVDYCAANAFLDAFAQASFRRRGPYFVSVGWDRWEEVGMAARSESPLGFWRSRAAEPLHPLLDTCAEASATREVYATEMRVERHWVLSEHRIAGHPTVPGTTYLEMARAAFARRAAGRPVELREVAFLSPLVVREGRRREVLTVLTALDSAGDACDVRVISREADEPWQEHARGRIAVSVAEPPAARDLDALLAACSAGQVTERARHGDFLVAGPRWGSLKRIHLGDGESVAELELDGRFAGDLESLVLHPALLDVAAGAVQLLGDGDYLPLAYERIEVRAPLPGRAFSHFRLRGEPGDLLTCDISILDPSGAVCAEIEGFSMRRVGREAAAQLALGGHSETPARDLPKSRGEGIFPNQGAQVLRRVLRDGVLPHLVVSTRDLQAVIDESAALVRARVAEALDSLAAPVAAHARPEVSSSYAAPTDDLEGRVAGIWERVLGIERVGIHDNFFELGGTSLTGIQLVSELKKQLGVEVPTVSIFEAPTVSALVRYLRPQARPGSAFDRSRSRAEKKKQVLAQARRVQGRRRG
ncbi:MAG: amino acid adenylation domain-containing protein [Acidobacteriota bacterium]